MAAFRDFKRILSAREYKRLITAATVELLKENPDLDAVNAEILAAEGIGTRKTAHLLRVKKSLANAEEYNASRSSAPKTAWVARGFQTPDTSWVTKRGKGVGLMATKQESAGRVLSPKKAWVTRRGKRVRVTATKRESAG